MDLTIRPAEHDDYDAVAAFTENTWPDRDGGDYIPRVFHDWIDTPDTETFVLAGEDDLAGICQGAMLTDHEAWAQGMRVNPDFRGQRVSPQLTYAVFDWAREQGATVCRNMVFSWNQAGLGQSRSVGFEPATEFRWATPTPDPEAESEFDVTDDPAAAWSCFQRSDAARHLRGLALDLDETYAVAELTRERLFRAADEERVFAVRDDDGTRAMSFRTRTQRYGDETTYAEYGVGAWEDVESARALFAAIARDAADLDADETRVFIPETVRHVSDVARVRAGFSDEPDFVLEADLTGR
ncbi:GNAT family N-acetyltransferase [Halorarius litoreus]|uniref:GNAT family N-acetyltransferase n=1 Tax=Halorarius litoreus TaxID=2962676 RepID=UPI0020CC7C6D|nr:GNAT family N-acetyltransferase [Halorarius litoreus]